MLSSSSIVRHTPAPSPTRTVARRTRRKFYYSLRLLLVPTLVREIIILFGIYMSFSTPSIYLYKATIKKYILHLYKATNSNRDKSYYYSLLSSLWLNFLGVVYRSSTTTTISLKSVVQQATLGYVTTPSFPVYGSISKSLQPR